MVVFFYVILTLRMVLSAWRLSDLRPSLANAVDDLFAIGRFATLYFFLPILFICLVEAISSYFF